MFWGHPKKLLARPSQSVGLLQDLKILHLHMHITLVRFYRPSESIESQHQDMQKLKVMFPPYPDNDKCAAPPNKRRTLEGSDCLPARCPEKTAKRRRLYQFGCVRRIGPMKTTLKARGAIFPRRTSLRWLRVKTLVTALHSHASIKDKNGREQFAEDNPRL